MRSAPASPPRLAPVPDPALATKNDMGCGGGAGCPAGGCPAGGCCATTRIELPTSATANDERMERMRPPVCRTYYTYRHVDDGTARLGKIVPGSVRARRRASPRPCTAA